MPDTELVHVDRNATFGQMAGGTGVVQMDVRDQTRIERFDRQIMLGQSGCQLIHRSGRTGFDEHRMIVAATQPAGDRTGKAQVLEVDWFD